jgi:hypothetical protein
MVWRMDRGVMVMKQYSGTLSISFDIPFSIEAENEEDVYDKGFALNAHDVLREYGMNTKYITNENIDAAEWEEE